MEDKALIVTLKLSKDNFLRWKYHVEFALKSRGLLDLVRGKIARPTGAEDVEERNNWDMADAKAVLLIESGLSEDDHDAIRDCANSIALWNRITGMRERTTEQNKVQLHQDFHSYRFRDGSTVAAYLSGLNVILQKLKIAGDEVSEPTVIAKIIMDLPAEFKNFRESYQLTTAAGLKLSLKEIQVQLSRVEGDIVRDREVSGTVDCGDAYAVQGKPKFDQKKSSKQKQWVEMRKCHTCGVKGHLMKDCPKKDVERKDVRESGHGYVASKDSEQFCEWIADSGATNHMTSEKKLFSSLVSLAQPMPITIGDDKKILAVARGTIAVDVYNGRRWYESTLNDVLLVPDLGSKNLFSIGAATDRGYDVLLNKDTVQIKKGSSVEMVGTRGGLDLYYLMIKPKPVMSALVVQGSLQLWHERLAHVSADTVKKMADSGMVKGLKLTTTEEFFCNGCALGKMAKKPFKSRTDRSTVVGEVIHSDLGGPMEAESLSGAFYHIVFKDEASAYRKVYFLKSKTEVLSKIKLFVAEQFAETGTRMKVLMTDNGSEYVNELTTNFLTSKGIKHIKSAPYVPEQNGLAERDQRSLAGLARSMLLGRDMPKRLWAEATATAAYVLNRVANRHDWSTTPYEKWHKKKPDVSHLRVFGTTAYRKIPSDLRKKWDPKSRKMVLVGYMDTNKNFRLWDEQKNRVFVVRDVEFDESTEIPRLTVATDIAEECPSCKAKKSQELDLVEETEDRDDPDDDDTGSREEAPFEPMRRGRPVGSKNYEKYKDSDQKLRRSIRQSGNYPPEIRGYLPAWAQTARCEPNSFQEAMASEEKVEWRAATNEEIRSLLKNETWRLSKLPKGRKAIKCRWVFKVKENPDGSIERYKARLVAKGFQQRPELDYKETYSSVVKMDTLRAFLSIVAARDMEMVHFDVKTAFLYGDLEEEIFMEQPEGYDDGSGLVCRLQHGLYGLKQASRQWNSKLTEFLLKFGFKQSAADSCVYVSDKNGSYTILAIYVDDGALASTDKEMITEIIDYLNQHFEMTVSEASCLVGLQIERDRVAKTLRIHQAGYIKKLLERFNMQDCKPRKTPADPSQKLVKSLEKERPNFPYKESVGGLMFAMVMARPDIAQAVGKAAQFMDCFDNSHVMAVKHIFRYLRGTVDRGITYGGQETLVGSSDADYAGDLTTRRSTSGYVFMMNGGAIAWSSKIQKVVAMSTTEAEYMAMAEATKQAIWMRQLLKDFGIRMSEPTRINCDNQGAIKLVSNPEFHQRTKHIDVRHHFIREAAEMKKVVMQYVASEEQPADIMTKALNGPKFEHCLKLIMFY